MTPPRLLVLAFNMLQDVNVLRPLAYLAARELDHRIVFLVSMRFQRRDQTRVWQREISRIAADVGGAMHVWDTPADVVAILQGRRGLLVAGSESSVGAHAPTHEAMRAAPPSFLKITLQHGHECVGFLHNRDHDKAHGSRVTFAADVVCGWSEAEHLRSLAPSERSKLVVTGPSARLQMPTRPPGDARPSGGIVCENLHSVRMRTSGDFTAPFMETFFRFCDRLGREGKTVTLRPHPGGQYVLKKKVKLPRNVTVNNHPIYAVDLSAYAFGISAPSTMLVDFLLADIPAAVWSDESGAMDASHYAGLAQIHGLDDWLAFERDAAERRDEVMERQRRALDDLAILTDRAEIYRRFARLLGAGSEGAAAPPVVTRAPERPKRVLFVANGMVPTLQICFLEPLSGLIASGEMAAMTLTEADLILEFGQETRAIYAADWLRAQIRAFAPDLIVCCRYSGPHAGLLLEEARKSGAPLVYHIDDDLLNVPPEIGAKKFRGHNMPERLDAVTTLLGGADLVYCSTPRLKRRLRQLGVTTPMIAGEVNCAGRVLRPAEARPARRIGYMGFDHAHDLDMALPAILRLMRANPELRFDLFGPIPMPEALAAFGDRVRSIEPVRAYDAFMARLAELEWDVGLCPLVTSPFNMAKANNKWVEYTAVGAAVAASRGTIYDECCADGCGLLCGSEDEWVEGVQRLLDDPQARRDQVARAQARLERDFSPDRLLGQILTVFDEAREARRTRQDAVWPHAARGRLARDAEPINAL